MSDEYAESDVPSTSTAAGGPSDGGGTTSEVEFVGWEPGVDDAPRKHTPRLQHRKSRAGCQQCRARRVKCDEVHPICTNCERHKSICVWGREKCTASPLEALPIRSNFSETKAKPTTSTAASAISESKDRRLTELYLLHHYLTDTSTTMNRDDFDDTLAHSVLIPRLAFKHDALLYAILAIASLHLNHKHPEEIKHMDTSQLYLGLALRCHRNDVATLSSANADAAMITSTTLRICSFYLLQKREVEPYTPPMEWLRMNHGTGHGLAVSAWQFLRDDSTSLIRTMLEKANVPGLNVKREGLWEEQSDLYKDNEKDLARLLKRTLEDELDEPWSDEIEAAYKSTISYISSVQQAIVSGESKHSTLRRTALFATMVYNEFLAVVREQRPRALVVLAYYFGVLAGFREVWWIGDSAAKEIRAIQKIVKGSSRWLGLMEWPMKAIEGELAWEQSDPEDPLERRPATGCLEDSLRSE